MQDRAEFFIGDKIVAKHQGLWSRGTISWFEHDGAARIRMLGGDILWRFPHEIQLTKPRKFRQVA